MSFKFPPVEPGDAVLYSRGPGSTDYAMAHVVRVADNTLDVVIFTSNGDQMYGPGPRQNVRHIDDPWLKDPANLNTMAEDGGMGVFKLRPKDVEFQSRLERIESSIETLYQSLGESQPKAKREKVAA